MLGGFIVRDTPIYKANFPAALQAWVRAASGGGIARCFQPKVRLSAKTQSCYHENRRYSTKPSSKEGAMSDLDHFINSICTQDEDRGDYEFHNGFTMYGPVKFTQLVPRGFPEVSAWREGQSRRVWKNEEQMSIITFQDGDVTVTRHKNHDSYASALGECERKFGKGGD